MLPGLPGLPGTRRRRERGDTVRNVYIAPITRRRRRGPLPDRDIRDAGDRPGARIQSAARSRRQTQLERYLAGVQRGELGHRASRRRAGSRLPRRVRSAQRLPAWAWSKATPSRTSRLRWRRRGRTTRIGCRWILRARCYLPGVPRATYMPHPFQIVQNAKRHSVYLSVCGRRSHDLHERIRVRPPRIPGWGGPLADGMGIRWSSM